MLVCMENFLEVENRNVAHVTYTISIPQLYNLIDIRTRMVYNQVPINSFL